MLPRRGSHPISSLDPVLRCPDGRCRKIAYHNPEMFLGPWTCRVCDGRFWVTRFEAGSIREQLVRHFEGEEYIVDCMMLESDLPDLIPRPMYWAILLSGKQFHDYNRGTDGGAWARTRQLFRTIVQGLRKAS